MIAVVLVALVLLILPSCQPVPVPPEAARQPAAVNIDDLELDDISPGHLTPEPKVKKTARQYVREGYRLLLAGKAREAQRALQSALRLAPEHRQAAMFLQQIEAEPIAVLGVESFHYRIRPNDTLIGLAERFLDDPLKFYLLARYNDLPNPSRITAGHIIKIPGKPNVLLELDPELATTPPPPAVAAPTVPPEAVAPPDVTTTTTPSVDAPEPPASPFGRYYAVVIGIDAYTHLNPLETAVTDAMAITQLLETRYGFNVTFLPDATRSHIVQVLDNLRAILTPQDNLLIYYAGHGWVDENAQGYWLPQDAMPDARAAWLATDDITRTVKAMAARHVMVIADSYYTGTPDDTGDDRKPVTDDERQAYLERMAGLRSRTAITSGGLKPVSARGGRHSAFAKAFLTALYDNGGILEGQRLFANMRHQLAVRSSQTPTYAALPRAEHAGGDFLFVPHARN